MMTRSKTLALAGLMTAALAAPPSWSDDYREKIEAERNEIVSRLESYATSLTRGEASLSRAVKAEALSRELDDPEALRVAERARRNAESAIRRLKLLHAAELERLRGLDRATRRTMLISPRDDGYVSRIRGTVTRTGGKPIDGPLEPGDTITTGRDGYFEVRYLRSSRLVLGPNTTLRVLDGDEVRYMQAKGLVYRAIRCLGNEWSCRAIHLSPTCAIGVRGTRYETEVGDDGRTTVRVHEGEVALKPTRDAAEAVVVTAGHEATVDRSGRVTARGSIGTGRSDRGWWRY